MPIAPSLKLASKEGEPWSHGAYPLKKRGEQPPRTGGGAGSSLLLMVNHEGPTWGPWGQVGSRLGLRKEPLHKSSSSCQLTLALGGRGQSSGERGRMGRGCPVPAGPSGSDRTDIYILMSRRSAGGTAPVLGEPVPGVWGCPPCAGVLALGCGDHLAASPPSSQQEREPTPRKPSSLGPDASGSQPIGQNPVTWHTQLPRG